MFKTFFAVLAAVCLVLVAITLLGVAAFTDPVGLLAVIAGVLLLSTLWRARRVLALVMALGVAASLAACASPALVTGQTVPTSGLSSAYSLAVLKEANRHIETCDRTYAWPFAVTIHCPPAATATQGLSAADVAGIVAKMLSAVQAPPSAPAPSK